MHSELRKHVSKVLRGAGRIAFIYLAVSTQALASDAGCQPGHKHTDAELKSAPPGNLQGSAEFPEVPAGKIRVFQQPIFPEADKRLFMLANRWHKATQPSVILSLLNFQPGEAVTDRTVAEAERLLRAKPYFFDARILVRQICDSQVDLDIVVREVWTLTPTLSLSRSGGESDSEIGFTDTNWRGSGRTVGLLLEREPTHTGVELFIRDSPAPDTWLRQLSIGIADEQKHFGASLSKPFYALETESAKGISVARSEGDQSLYLLGDEVLSYDVERRQAQVFAGIKLATRDTRVIRGITGWRFADEHLQPVFDPAATAVDIHRRFSYPFGAIEWVDDQFVKATDLSRIGLVEDINLGWQGRVEVGLSNSVWGASGDYVHASASIQRQWLLADVDLISARLTFSGRFNSDESTAENVQTELDFSYLHKWSRRWRTFIGSQLTHGRNLDPENTLQLGGRTGMRAFPSNYQAGSKRYIVALEQRLHTSLQPFDLFRLAYVAFADLGRAWYDNPPRAFAAASEDNVIFDAGVGIRLESIRTGNKRVLHLDVATPLRSAEQTSSYEVTFTVKQNL